MLLPSTVSILAFFFFFFFFFSFFFFFFPGQENENTTSGTDLDVQSVDAKLLAASSNVLGSQHGSVGRGLVTVSLDLHTTGDTADGFATAV